MSMNDNTIRIPVEGKEFYNDSMDKALAACLDDCFAPAFMPQIVDIRIASEKKARIWQTWWTAPSIRATGKTNLGNAVVVYAHVPNYFSNPSNIKEAMKNLVNGAGIIPQKDFNKLLTIEDGENVLVVDYDKLRKTVSGVVSIENAMEHPQTIPFLGGREQAEKYLQKHKEVYGDKIGIWHSDDLGDKPVGRLLFLGGYGNGLGGDLDLNYNARFVGVPKSAAGATPVYTHSPLEKLVGKGVEVGNGLVVVKKEDLSDRAYQLLTGKR